MLHYKGTLNYYAATGESPHYYVWTGDADAKEHDWSHHVMIHESDVVEATAPDKKTRIIIQYFPAGLKDLKKILGDKGYKTWNKAVKNSWPVEIVKLHDNRNLN